METQLRGCSSLRVPMSPEEFRALGETKHAEYYDGMCVVNPSSRRHVVAVRRLARLLEDACPAGFTVYPDWAGESGDMSTSRTSWSRRWTPPRTSSSRPRCSSWRCSRRPTRDADLGSKMADYAAAGAPLGDWTLAGPEDRLGISLVVWRNGGADFVEAQRIQGTAPQQSLRRSRL